MIYDRPVYELMRDAAAKVRGRKRPEAGAPLH